MVSFRPDFTLHLNLTISWPKPSSAALALLLPGSTWGHRAGLSSGCAALVSSVCVFSLVQLKGLCKMKRKNQTKPVWQSIHCTPSRVPHVLWFPEAHADIRTCIGSWLSPLHLLSGRWSTSLRVCLCFGKFPPNTASTFTFTRSSLQGLLVHVVGLRWLIPLPQQAAGTLGEEWCPGVVFNAAATTSGYPGTGNLCFSLRRTVLKELSTEGTKLASLHCACLGGRAGFQELP